MSRKLYRGLTKLRVTPCPSGVPDRGEKVYARGGRIVGRATGTQSACTLACCRGTRVSVVWSDGSLTRPCTTGMKVRKDGCSQIA